MKKKQQKLSVLLNNEIGIIKAGEYISLNGWAIRQNGRKDSIIRDSICCSSLNRAEFKPITELIFSVRHRFGKDWVNHPRWNEFLNFMLNKSFIKDVFLTKNVGNANKHGIRMNLEWSSNYILGGFFFIRCAWEYPWYLDSFFIMVNEGIDWNLALTQCQYIEFKGDAVINRASTGHTALGSLSKESCKKLLTQKLIDVVPQSPLKLGKFLSMRVNNTLSDGTFGSSFIFNGLPLNSKSKNEWGEVRSYASKIDLLNKLKEFQKECLI